jgi:hypothetical protein
MARPTTKQDLISAANEQYKKLWELIDAMPAKEQNATFSFEDRDKNIRDVLVHLYEWQQLLLNWVRANQNGEQKPFIPEPYNFRTYGVMNVEIIWKKHQNTPYDKSKEMLKDSHSKVMKLIETFSNDELFTKKYFSWTGTSTLGSYCISTTSSHYDWAIKKIKKHKKAYSK